MIVYDLCCDDGHTFEVWFKSSSSFAKQVAGGLVVCPQCGSCAIEKAVMAPAVCAKGNTKADDRSGQHGPASVSSGEGSPATEPMTVANQPMPMPKEVEKALSALAKAQSEALKQSTWVGDKFAETSRAMHYGEEVEKPIHGQASVKEAELLAEEGIAVAPLPFPIASPDKLN